MEYVNANVGLEKIPFSPSYSGVIALKDGRLMWMWGAGNVTGPATAIYSDDEGQTWSDPKPVKLTTGKPLEFIYETSLFRLPSGALGLIMTHEQYRRPEGGQYGVQAFCRSDDEGETWSPPMQIDPEHPSFNQNDSVTVLRDGRIILAVYSSVVPTPVDPDVKSVMRFGESFVSAEAGALSFSYTYYSDDEGKTWQRSRNQTLVVREKGALGFYSMGEPTVIELSNGRLMMYGRVNLGRIYESCSENRGESWTQAMPTNLAAYPSPRNLKRIPKTGDLLLIWNQLSRWEAMRGLYRHRLTCAISQDEGKTWTHRKNLESLDDVTEIEPVGEEALLIGGMRQPEDRQRYHRAPGPLRYNDATCAFFGDEKVIITYCMAALGSPDAMKASFGADIGEVAQKWGFSKHPNHGSPQVPPSKWWAGAHRVRVLSTGWFYQ